MVKFSRFRHRGQILSQIKASKGNESETGNQKTAASDIDNLTETCRRECNEENECELSEKPRFSTFSELFGIKKFLNKLSC
jgi:hypothetical protein